jgi:hypothetical protein
MLRFWQNLNLADKRRTLRAQYAATQAYPYAVALDSAFSRTGGATQLSLSQGGTSGLAAIFPGAAMQKISGEVVTLAFNGVTGYVSSNSQTAVVGGNENIFGLSGHFVGGTMDELGTDVNMAVWRGRGAVFEILAPVFATTVSSKTSVGASFLTWNASAQISDVDSSASNATADNAIARLVDNLNGSANAVLIELLTP